ncbi:MAG: hypothetical protein J4F30_04650 [Acidobacteria bacterium]|nr:hypothetical protein [Acidobacteriota bacterium]
MTGAIDVEKVRKALVALPEGTSHGEAPIPEHVYLPPSHVKAMDPNNSLVTGMRGAGKTFWWSALQEPEVRQLVAQQARGSGLSGDTEVRTGFGVTPATDKYPGKDVLLRLMRRDVEPRIIWRTVQAWQLAPNHHPLRQRETWPARAEYVEDDPEAIDRLFQQRDSEFDGKGTYLLILFDALDRCADDWQDMYRAIRGLLQTALEMRAYRRLRVKMFLRSDQVPESEVADFPDASKVLSSRVELSWPRHELYGLLWNYLANGESGDLIRAFLHEGGWRPTDVGQRSLFALPRAFVKEESQREKFHEIAGRWMGKGPKRGFPYSWIPNHLGDGEGRVSPRSFLSALRTAADDTASRYAECKYTLHYDGIKHGVRQASTIRVNEIREDYPWVDRVLRPLQGMVVPCGFEEIAKRWRMKSLLDGLTEDVEKEAVKLPPRHIGDGPDGVRRDLESLGVFQRLHDGRVNMPDVFRVGYGLGRKGGVRPVR